MMKPLMWAVAMMSLGTFIPCSSAGAQDPGPNVVATNSQPFQKSGFRVGSKPDWSLDLRADIPAGPLNIVGAARLRNGIVVAEGLTPRLFVYSSDRKLLRVVPLKSGSGRTGRATSLQRVNGDTLAVLSNREGWVINAGDTLPSTVSFAESGHVPGRISSLFAVLPDGSSVWGVLDLATQPRPPAKRVTDSVDLMLQSSTREIRKLRRLPALTLGTDSAGNSKLMWFYPHLVWGALRNSFYYGFGTDYIVTRLDPFTGEEKSWRRAWVPAKVTKAEIDDFIQGWSINWNRGPDSIAVKAAMRNDPFAEFIPAFSQFIISAAEEVWVRTPDLFDAQAAGELNTVPYRSSQWSVFDHDGHWLADVSLPAGFQPTDIGLDYILGIQFGMKNGTPTGRERSVVSYKYSKIH